MSELIAVSRTWPKKCTYGELYTPLMALQTREEVLSYLRDLIKWNMDSLGSDLTTAAAIEVNNTLYFSGYFSEDIHDRYCRLLGFDPQTCNPITLSLWADTLMNKRLA
jgi:hypothetical protein